MMNYTAHDVLNVKGRELELDNQGYLLYPDDWDVGVAEAMAECINVELTEERWTVVNFVRDYFETKQSVPEARFAPKAMK